MPIFVVFVCPFVFIWQLRWNRLSWNFILQNWSDRCRPLHILVKFRHKLGHAMAQLVEALRYKPEGRGFNSQCCHWNFSLAYSFQPHYDPGVDSARTSNTSWGAKTDDNLTIFMYRLSWNLGTSTFWNPQEMSRPVQGLRYLYLRTQMTDTWQEDDMRFYELVD